MNAPDTGLGWREWADSWRDVVTAPVLAVMGLGLAFHGFTTLEAVSPGAVLMGIAAVITSAAAVIEAKRGSDQAATISDHEARLRVLEDRGQRS